VFSSLDRMDLVVEKDGRRLAIQTDHRPRAEIEAEPEISVLFALTRVIGPRQAMEREGQPLDGVVYAAFDEPPAFLVEALASVGALLEVQPERVQRTLGPVEVTPEVLIDRAFTNLAARVARRTGLTDPATVLRTLEAEVLADPPDIETDEITYWTRVLELVAMVVAVIRVRHAGAWVLTDSSDIPFALSLGEGHLLLPGNRARRFLSDGADESMFLLVGSMDEVAAGREGAPRGPILPSLRSRAEAQGAQLLFRPLLDAESDHVPVIAYGNDGDNTFGLLLRANHEARAETVHHEALANIAGQEVEIEDLPIDDMRLFAISGSFFATEKLLDAGFMRRLAAKCDAELLAVGVPRRGLMFVAPFDDKEHLGALMRVVGMEYERGGSRGISPSVLFVHDGKVVGLAQVSADAADPEPPPKKPGFFKRLFRRRE
jgi:hypothetical protein